MPASQLFSLSIDCCISINADFKSITFYMLDKKDKKKVNIESDFYKSRPFESDFYEMLKNMVAIRFKNNKNSGRVALILPDTLFLTDNVKIPTIQKKAMAQSLNLAIDALYKNSSDVKFITTPLGHDKKTATYGILGLRKEIIAKVTDAVERGGANVQSITFSANALVNGALAINPKLKNANFILVDIKKTFTNFAFVVHGKTLGCYSLPFGYDAIRNDLVINEVSLFDHSAGDLLVLNAKEKAKNKQLTSISLNQADDDELTEAQADELEDIDTSDDEYSKSSFDNDEVDQKNNSINKRLNRKLPKFMLRPIPTSPEEFEYENFRPFVKWTLELIRNNQETLSFGAPECVYVNMPSKFYSLLELVNNEKSENKITFEPLNLSKQGELNRENLELFGGLYVKKYNRNNNF